jgi:arabinan endo-1,5-alpha-L-arabinosidase
MNTRIYISLMSLCALISVSCAEKIVDERPIKNNGDVGFTTVIYQNPVIRNNCPDPSVFDDRARSGYFYAISTQNGTSDTETVVYMPIYRSKDMVNWELVGNAFGEDANGKGIRPQWVPDTRIWAPDMEYDEVNNRYCLYYAEGHWDNPDLSAVGVAVSDSPTGPYTWENVPELNEFANAHGMLVDYRSQGVTNSIDGNLIRDAVTGEKYLFWGSFGAKSGVWAIKLTDDGLAIAPGAVKTQIAYSMEGTYVHYNPRTQYYYCFGSKGSCCAGSKSTYHIVVGRSQNILGPYVGRDGKTMLQSSFDNAKNTIMSNPEGNYFAGTGHNAEIITDDSGQNWMFYHAYWQGNNYNGRCMNMDQIVWTDDGWPSFTTAHPTELKTMGPKWKKGGQTGGTVSTPGTTPDNEEVSEGNGAAKQNCGDCRNTSQWDGATPEDE